MALKKMKLPIDRSGFGSFLLTIITLGIYGLYLYHRFAQETNTVCKEDEDHTKNIEWLIVLSVITFGIYFIVWKALLVERRHKFLLSHNRDGGLSLSAYLLTTFLWGWLTLGIMYIVVFCKFIYQQNKLNALYNELNNL